MKRYFFAVLFFSLTTLSFSQNLGVSFSFFFPTNGGEIATPISPFSYRGLALPFTNNLGVQTGISLYRMPGLNIKGLPFESEKPMYGPNMTFYIPLELYIQGGNQNFTASLKGGVFGFYSIFTSLNMGNIDRAIRTFEGWEVANADLSYSKLPGWGYQGGIEFLFNVTRQFGITVEVNYLFGASNLELNGTYSGGDNNGLITRTVDYNDAQVDLSGLEISLGAVF